MKVFKDVLWPEIKPYKWRFAVIILFGAIISSLKGLTPKLMDMLVVAWTQNDKQTAYLVPIVVAITWCVAGIFRYFQMYWMKFIAERISVKLRKDLMNKYLYLNLSYLQNFIKGTGGLISRMIGDIQVVQQGTQRLSDIVREPFMVLFSIGYLIYIDWTVLGFIVLTLPMTSAAISSLSKSIRKYGHKSLALMEDISKTLKESLDGSRIVQSYNLQDEMRNKFNEKTDNYLEARRKIISREEMVGPTSETLFSIAMAFILLYIGHQVVSGKLTVANFMGLQFSLGLLADSVKKIQSGYVKLQQSVVALERYKDILNQGEEVKECESPVEFPHNWNTIEFKNVQFTYGGEPVLRGINLIVKKGEIVALVGSSGGGKSTLVNLLGRFYEPSSGEILINGINIQNFKLADLRKNIGLVSQDVFLFSDTVEYNILAGDFNQSSEKAIQAAKHANAHNFIMESPEGYQSRAGERGTLFSGGEKQRISIARAILKDAPILILDEATSALDSENEKDVQTALVELMKGRTSFVIAHRLSTITHADRILVINKGQIVEEGKHSELIKSNGEYQRLVEIQGRL